MVIGGWLAVKSVLERGPTITITFKTAEGLEEGKTAIKYKNVGMGLAEPSFVVVDFNDAPQRIKRVIDGVYGGVDVEQLRHIPSVRDIDKITSV